MTSLKQMTKPNRKEDNMYTLKQTQQLIKENPYTCNLDEQEQTEILNSKEYNRTFIITSELNTEDYSQPARDYNIIEINLKKGGQIMQEEINYQTKQFKRGLSTELEYYQQLFNIAIEHNKNRIARNNLKTIYKKIKKLEKGAM